MSTSKPKLTTLLMPKNGNKSLRVRYLLNLSFKIMKNRIHKRAERRTMKK
jgi:hypothetical protein